MNELGIFLKQILSGGKENWWHSYCLDSAQFDACGRICSVANLSVTCIKLINVINM